MEKVIYIAPRVLGVAAILFISIFALDVFTPETSLGEELLGFAIHLIPSAVLTVILVIAWRFEWLGAALFVAVGCSAFFLLHRSALWHFAIIGGPFIVTGLLFALSAWYRRD